MEHIKKLSLRNIANITNYCADLGYLNYILLDILEKEIIKRLKMTPEFQSLLRGDIESDIMTLLGRQSEKTSEGN